MVDQKNIEKALASVCDPEIPVLTVYDLGIIRDVETINELIKVTITPTYSGCPAMNTIEMNIVEALNHAGYQHVEINTVLSPAWTTDWITEEGKLKLKEYGIAPPKGKVDKTLLTDEFTKIECPQCKSSNTEMISQFGSTACKSLFKCLDCLEPFDYFKCH